MVRALEFRLLPFARAAGLVFAEVDLLQSQGTVESQIFEQWSAGLMADHAMPMTADQFLRGLAILAAGNASGARAWRLMAAVAQHLLKVDRTELGVSDLAARLNTSVANVRQYEQRLMPILKGVGMEPRSVGM